MTDLEAMTESDAMALIQRLEDRFGWGVLVMTRQDAADRWHQDEPGDERREITDAQWDAVQHSWAWRKGFSGDLVMEAAWSVVDYAVEQARETL